MQQQPQMCVALQDCQAAEKAPARPTPAISIFKQVIIVHMGCKTETFEHWRRHDLFWDSCTSL